MADDATAGQEQLRKALYDLGVRTGWHTWEGVAGILYARRLLSSPPRVVRATTVDDLAAAIEADKQLRREL
jgi:hypothetical protein